MHAQIAEFFPKILFILPLFSLIKAHCFYAADSFTQFAVVGAGSMVRRGCVDFEGWGVVGVGVGELEETGHLLVFYGDAEVYGQAFDWFDAQLVARQ
jgi:hypothetical protein